MKSFPEKMVMAAVILSCGFVLGAEPSARHAKVKHASVTGVHTWEMLPSTEASLHPARASKAVAMSW
jgi:hypothetical protein